MELIFSIKVGEGKKLIFFFTNSETLACSSSQSNANEELVQNSLNKTLKHPTYIVEWGGMKGEADRWIRVKIGNGKHGKKGKNKRKGCKRN